MDETMLQPTPVPLIDGQPAWHRLLRECGYPTDVVVIDFENYFDDDYTLKKMSTIEYINDARYEEIGKAILHIKQPFERPAPAFWRNGNDSYFNYLTSEYGRNWEGITVVAQNFSYDGLILARKYGIVPPHCIDLLGLARHEEPRRRNKLEDMAKREGLPPKGDTLRFKGLHGSTRIERISGSPPRILWRGMGEADWMAMAEYANHDAWLEWGLFTRYFPRLSNPRFELQLMQHTLELFWKPTLQVDAVYAADLITKMEARIEEVVTTANSTRDEISGNNTFGALLATALDRAGDKIDRYQKIGKPNKDGSEKKLLAIAKDDDQLAVLNAHKDGRVRELMAARTAVKSWPLHIKRVQNIAAQAAANQGTIPVPLKYCGAHTGRWSGGEKINLQNLPSRSKEKIINDMRGVLIAGSGRKLVVVDASQVEARGLSWIAGQEDLNRMFRDGIEIYCEYAGRMVGKKLRKSRKSDPELVRKYLDRMRNMGKVQVLGCGYGMGADKCIDFASATYGVDIAIPEAGRLVQSYRASVPNITKFWRVVEQRFKAAARYGESGTMDRGLRFHRDKDQDIVYITLPSGRQLKYPHVRISIINGKESLWMYDPGKPGSRIFMWGGYLTENIVQALCRDLLGHAILECEKAGLHVALHTHDEVVEVVPEAEAEDALATTIKIFSTPPAWATGCPLAAEGKIVDRYTK